MDKRKLRKAYQNMEYPKSLPQECLYYSMISVDRHRLLMLTVFTEGTRKSCAFVDKRTEEVLVLTEKGQWRKTFRSWDLKYSKLPQINTKAARKYFDVVDESRNMYQYIDRWIGEIGYKRQQETISRSVEEAAKIWKKLTLPKGVVKFGRELLEASGLYSGRRVFCTKCRKWHSVPKRPKNGSTMACPLCETALVAKPLVSSLKSEVSYFYFLQKYKNYFVVCHCKYRRVLHRGEVEELVDIFWIDLIDTVKRKRKTFHLDYCGYVSPGKGGVYSSCDPRLRAVKLYTKNLPTLLKGTTLEYAGLEKFTGYLYVEDVILAYLRNPKIEFLIKGGYEKLLFEIACNSSVTQEISKLSKSVLSMDNSLGLDEYQLFQKCNGKVTLSDYHTIADIGGLRKQWRSYESLQALKKLVACTELTGADGKKVLNYITSLGYCGDDFINALSDYRDYLRAVCDVLEVDKVPKNLRYPKELNKAHDSYTKKATIKHNASINEAMLTATKDYPDSLRFGGFAFVFLKDFSSLIHEGKVMHHCVGSRSYAEEVADGKGLIVSVRKELNTPLYTLEITIHKSGVWTCAQCRGIKNRTPEKADREIIDQFISAVNTKQILIA